MRINNVNVLKKTRTDDELASMGYKCHGHAVDFIYGEDLKERLARQWVWFNRNTLTYVMVTDIGGNNNTNIIEFKIEGDTIPNPVIGIWDKHVWLALDKVLSES